MRLYSRTKILPFAPVLTCKFMVIFSLTQCRAPQKIPLTTFDVDVGYTPGKVANLLG